MAEGMSNEDKLELERRRMTDEVTESVEKSLRKRYTWLAIIVSFMIGGGVATIIDNLTASAQKKLFDTERALDEIQVLLKTGRASIDSLKDMSEKSRQVKEDLESLNQARESSFSAAEASLEEIEKLKPRVEELINAVNKLAKKEQISDIQLASSKSPSNNVQAALQRTKLGRYGIFLHYSNEENREIMNKLSLFLKNRGYIVPRIQVVNYRVRDIRYYHSEDMGVTEYVQQSVNDFFKSQNMKEIPLKIKNLGKEYPRIKRGTIEVWLYL